VLSYRRNISHISVVSYRTKKDGAKRENIAFMNCSFLELDGSTDNTIKSLEDVQTLIKNNNLPTASYVIETSKGNFHVLWIYSRPLPWTNKGESYWLAQQKRLIQLFQKAGFLVDKMASLNPCQNLRNPSQLNAYNFKRGCEVFIHSSYNKTSLRAIFKALNGTSIANPKPVPASTKLRRYSRANKGFTATLFELAGTLGICTKTAQREVSKAVANGDLVIVKRSGNNKGIKRTTEYTSNLYIEADSQKGQTSSITNNSVRKTKLLQDFQANGTEKGRRNKTIFMLGLEIKAQLGERASVGALRAELEGGARHCHFPEKEFERTLKNIMKISYTNPFSLSKLREWNLIEEPKHFH